MNENNNVKAVRNQMNDQEEIKKSRKLNERKIAIIGNSLVKDVDPFELRKNWRINKKYIYIILMELR